MNDVIGQASKEMPKYECHKKVRALQIESIEISPKMDEGARLHVGEGFSPIPVTVEWLSKHQPYNGGYYVVYKDGYTSFSPAEAFEAGYTRI